MKNVSDILKIPGAQKLFKIAAEIGAQEAIKEFKKQDEESFKKRCNRRLRNTELLLRNYRTLAEHRVEAVYTLKKAIALIDGVYIYDKEGSDELFVDAIKKSTERTTIILMHIDKMLEMYKRLAESSDKPEDLRRYKIIYGLYIDEEKKSAENLCDNLRIAQATFYRDKKSGIQYLSGLLFGIDSLKMR